MAKIRAEKDGCFSFYCPGCKHEHIYFVNSEYWTRTTGKAGWTFNNDFQSPTFSPSLLNTWGKHADPKYVETEGFANQSGICHLFVTNGRIEYCGDSTHKLSGKTVDMIDIE